MAEIRHTGRKSFDALQQYAGLNTKRAREGNNVEEADVALPSFHGSNVGAVKVGACSEFLLRETPFAPTFAD